MLSCSGDSDGSSATSATISVVDGNNKPIVNLPVYVFTDIKYEVYGWDALSKAEEKVYTDSNGNAKFTNLEYPDAFIVTEEKFHFHIRSTDGQGGGYKNIQELTLKKGQHKKYKFTVPF